jgi:hypothetical protein
MARVLLKTAVVAAAAIAALAPLPAHVVERWYSLPLFPHLQRVVTPLSNVVPFALFDVLVIAGIGLIVWRIGRLVRDIRAGASTGAGTRMRFLFGSVARAGGDLFVGGAAMYMVFLLMWGLNYRRMPMADRIQLAHDRPGTERVVELGQEAVRQLNELHAVAHAGGWVVEEWRNRELLKAFETTQAMLSDAAPARAGRLKWTIFGPYFRWSSIDGMVDPFALEALGNPDLLPWERPFVAAHEWAHLAGYAHEAEANFVGWLTCVRADAASRYSGWLFLYWQLAGELPGDEARRLAATLGAGPQRDIAAIVDRLRRGRLPLLRRVSWRVYDQYLKANRVRSGVRSYGEVLTLILRARFRDGWEPVRARDGGGMP